MSKSIEQLVITLNKERDIYREIYDLSKSKREAIKLGDMANLDAITRQEQGLVVTLFKLEEIREKVMDLIMREFNLDLIDNVSQLLDFLDYEDRQKVSLAKDELLVNIKNVSDESKFNNQILEDRLELIKLNIDLMTQISDDSGQYNRKASNEEQERRSLFDRRV